LNTKKFFGQDRIRIRQFSAAVVSRHSSPELRSKFDRWSASGSELNGDQCLNSVGVAQIMAELGSKSNLTRVQSWTTLVQWDFVFLLCYLTQNLDLWSSLAFTTPGLLKYQCAQLLTWFRETVFVYAA